MARIVESTGLFIFTRTTYPWDIWTDGQARVLEAGVDYNRSFEAFRAYLYKVASRRGKRVAVGRHADGMVVMFVDRIGADEGKSAELDGLG